MLEKTERSYEFWLIAFYLSNFGENIEGKQTQPPTKLKTDKWHLAYQIFYEHLGDNRTISTFQNSLKNARDAYDSHLKKSSRVGWLDKRGNPNPLEEKAKGILEKYSNYTEENFWELIRKYANLSIVNFGKEVEDLIAIQEIEDKDTIETHTEGGKKVVISFRYERSLTLRNAAFKIHGYDCAVCGFNYETAYGVWGKGFAEVHHIEPLSEKGKDTRQTNAKTDLVVLCANCHRMVHRKKAMVLSIEELQTKYQKRLLY